MREQHKGPRNPCAVWPLPRLRCNQHGHRREWKPLSEPAVPSSSSQAFLDLPRLQPLEELAWRSLLPGPAQEHHLDWPAPLPRSATCPDPLQPPLYHAAMCCLLRSPITLHKCLCKPSCDATRWPMSKGARPGQQGDSGHVMRGTVEGIGCDLPDAGKSAAKSG